MTDSDLLFLQFCFHRFYYTTVNKYCSVLLFTHIIIWQRKDKGNEKQKDGVSTNPKTTTECASEDRCSSAEIHKSVIEGEKNRSDSLTQSDDDVSGRNKLIARG